ncbi:hypothetical protein [Microbacterium phyllosphaerae]|uniref:hypothetical protein n=1 Tax=Microbacterium phyllosphaerae TaxID=124798 RepID=UPI003D64C941
MTARLITILITLVLTPIALILLSVGGQAVNLTLFSYGFDGYLAPLVGPLLLQTLGLVLLILVVLTGIRSSAGLIVVGIFSIVPLIVAVFPVTLSWIIRIQPRDWGDGLVYGIPLVVLAALGAMGLVLVLVRRDPRPKGTALGVIGIVAAPLLLTAGAWAITWGIADGALFALQRFQFDLRPGAAAAVFAGTLLVLAGIAVSRWSPFALILPALALLIASILLIAAPDATFRMLFQLPRGLNAVIPTLLLYGGGAAAGLLYLTFTVVLLRVRRQSRLTGDGSAHSGDTSSAQAQYSAGQYSGTQYPGAQHPGAQNAQRQYPPSQYPPAPTQHPYPPAPGQQQPPAPYPPQPGP